MTKKKQKPTARYKLWIEIERIDTDENGNETYHDEECPRGIAYRDTEAEIGQLADEIENTFGELPTEFGNVKLKK